MGVKKVKGVVALGLVVAMVGGYCFVLHPMIKEHKYVKGMNEAIEKLPTVSAEIYAGQELATTLGLTEWTPEWTYEDWRIAYDDEDLDLDISFEMIAVMSGRGSSDEHYDLLKTSQSLAMGAWSDHRQGVNTAVVDEMILTYATSLLAIDEESRAEQWLERVDDYANNSVYIELNYAKAKSFYESNMLITAWKYLKNVPVEYKDTADFYDECNDAYYTYLKNKNKKDDMHPALESYIGGLNNSGVDFSQGDSHASLKDIYDTLS